MSYTHLVEPYSFCKQLMEDKYPEEFAQVLYELTNGTDKEVILATAVMVHSVLIDRSYSMAAHIAFGKILEEDESREEG